jgi:hypothetical protein
MVILIIAAGSMVIAVSCSGNSASSTSSTLTIVKPNPSVVSVNASTSGVQNAYYAILDIIVKNSGADGTILVTASITQAGTTTQNQMPIYIKSGHRQELKMTFPIVWQGGE